MASLPVALQARGPEWKDPLETYKQTASLADLLQQRRYRALQEESIRQKLEDERQDRAEYQRAQQAFASLPEGASLGQVVTAAGSRYGIPYYTQSRQAQTAALQQREAEAKYTDLVKNVMLHEIEAIAVESDPQRQQELFKSASGKFAKMGILTPEQAAMPFDRKMLQTIYTKIKGGDEWQKLEGTRLTNEENRKKAADEAEKREFEIAGYWAGNVKDQGSYDQWLKIAPKRLAETLPKEFTPEGWQKTQNVLLTQQQRMQEVRAQATQTRLEQPTQLGDWVRIKHDPNSTTAEVARANAAIADFQAQARAGAINITPNQRISNESGLRDDYRQDTKNYVSVRDAYTKIQRAAQSGTAAGDISLIYGYMRMQDPTSTVREGEFATAQNAGSIPDRIRVLYNKAINGERLAPNIRADFLNQASNIYQQAEADYDQLVETYTEIARSGGMNPRSVVINLKPAKVPQPGDAKAGEIIERNGVKFRFKGGDKNRQENWEKIG